MNKPIFIVCADKKAFNIKGVKTLMRGQKNLGVTLPCRCLVEVINNDHKVFIRKGRNQNAGTAQKEVLLVSEDGSIDPSTPVVFNYEKITSIKAIPTDEKPISIKGGTFTTIANRREGDFTYHSRGFSIRRSGTRVEGITHLITGEGDMILRNCTMRAYPTSKEVSLISGANDGSHDFGYPCQLPTSVTIETLVIDDSHITDTEKYTGPTVLTSFERKEVKEEPFPFGTKCNITLKDITVTSGRPLILAPNPEAFPEVTIL